MVSDCGHDLVGFMGLIRWVSVTILMGLRSGWWVLVRVENKVGRWVVVGFGWG